MGHRDEQMQIVWGESKKPANTLLGRDSAFLRVVLGLVRQRSSCWMDPPYPLIPPLPGLMPLPHPESLIISYPHLGQLIALIQPAAPSLLPAEGIILFFILFFFSVLLSSVL